MMKKLGEDKESQEDRKTERLKVGKAGKGMEAQSY